MWQKLKRRLNSYIQSFYQEIEKDYTTEDWVNKGDSHYKRKKFDKAINAFDRAIKSNPNHAYAWYRKGNALFDLKNTKDAIIALVMCKHIWRNSLQWGNEHMYGKND